MLMKQLQAEALKEPKDQKMNHFLQKKQSTSVELINLANEKAQA